MKYVHAYSLIWALVWACLAVVGAYRMVMQ